MKELNELVELAKKATRGEWSAFISTAGDGTFSIHTPDDSRKGNVVSWPGFDTANCPKAQKKANAKYIAAANPATILAIAEAYQALENERNYYRNNFLEMEQRAEAEKAAGQAVAKQLGSVAARAQKAEAKLAELEKQEAAGKQYRVSAKGNNSATGWSLWHDGDGEQYRNSYDVEVRDVFTRPAPAVSLAELVPEENPPDEIMMLKSNSVDASCKRGGVINGWSACRAAILRNIEEAK